MELNMALRIDLINALNTAKYNTTLLIERLNKEKSAQQIYERELVSFEKLKHTLGNLRAK